MTRTFHKIMSLGLALLIAGPAIAAPVLKSSISISSAIVTVGDMFDDAGLNAESALFRAPAPGTAGAVSVQAIRIAAAKVGLSSFQDMGLTRVRVERSGIAINEETIKSLITGELERRGELGGGIYADPKFNGGYKTLFAILSDNPVQLTELRYTNGSNRFVAIIQIAGEFSPREISGRLDLMIKVPHLINSLRTGAIIAASDIEMRAVSLNYARSIGFADIDQIEGKQLRRATRSGMMLRPNDIIEPQLIGRNETVTLYYRKGPLTLTINGLALNAAAMGETVNVLNTNSKNIVRGTAIGPGAVELNADILNVARNEG